MAQIQSLRPPKIFACLFHEDAGKKYQGDQVRNGHQPVHDICEVPYRIEGEDGSEKCRDHEEESIDDGESFPSEVFYGFFSVVGPS